MNIWILNQYALPGNAAGGTRHAVLAKYLQRRGHSVTIFAANMRHTGGKAFAGAVVSRRVGAVTELLDGVYWRFVPIRGYHSPLTRFLSMRSYRTQAIVAADGLATPDVIVGSCVHPYAVDAARCLAQRYQVPFVYEIRDIWPASLLDVGALSRWNPIYWQLRQLELRAFRQAQGVIGVCPGMKDYAAQHGVEASRFLYAPNGIDPEVFSAANPAQAAQPFVVSYLGSQGPVNGLMTLVEAARRLQDKQLNVPLRIRLVGDGTDRPRLQRQVAEWGLRNVEFLAPVAKSEVVALCQSSQAFVYCHRPMPVVAKYGVSANKIFDYLAAARPIVFSCNSLNDPVRDAEAGISVPAGDAGSLAEAIARISMLPLRERQRLGANGRAYVLNHHNLASIAEQWESFLRERVSDEGGRS
jgi:glycosyltransferase involved in cell wall biosynthesis